MLDLYISAIIYGLCISGILFLVSIGISIGFGLMRIINMEQMIYYTFGAYLAYYVSSQTGSFLLGLLSGTLMAGISGFIVETQLLRRVHTGRDIQCFFNWNRYSPAHLWAGKQAGRGSVRFDRQPVRNAGAVVPRRSVLHRRNGLRAHYRVSE
jgi:hypothetical protein